MGQPGNDTSFYTNLTSVSFGKMKFKADGTPEKGHYETISDSALTALIAYNYNGIGLPEDIYNKLSDLIVQKSSFYCSGLCVYQGSCADLESFWKYSFLIKLQGQSNYLVVPIGAFSYQEPSGCYL